MSKLEHSTTRQLIDRVNSQNRRFRVASVVFGAVTVLGLLLLVLICLSTLSGVNRQLEQQKKLLDSQAKILSSVQASGDQRTEQLRNLQSHIDCIITFFGLPNRSSLSIQNVCHFIPNSASTATPSNSSSNGASAPAQSAPAKTSTPSTGASNKKPTPQQSTLDRIPVLGRVFKKLGL